MAFPGGTRRMAIEGYLDHVSEQGVAGWAFDTENPGAHLTVIIRREGRLIGEARCNIFRPDLLEANVGRGDHAFVYNFATAIAPRDVGHISASIAGEMLPLFEPCVDGSLLARAFFTFAAGSVQPCVRPVCAVHMTAGHNAFRGSGPGQKPAFDHALAQVGCPERRIDRHCITCCSPFQPSHHAGFRA